MDNPGTVGVTPAFWDTVPQGGWSRRQSKDNTGTAGETLLWGCWGVEGEGGPRINPG